MSKFDNYSRRLTWLMALLLSALAAGCGSGGSGGGVVILAPKAIAVTPPANAAGVPVNTKIIAAAFSKAMDPATLTTASFTLACPAGTPVTGAVTYLAAGNVATLTLPAAPDLAPGTVCTVTVTTAAKDTSAVALASNFVWKFTTGITPDSTAPAVKSTVPLANATGVPVNTPVTAIFSEPMDPLTINTATFSLACPAGTPITGTVGYGVTGDVATFTPSPGPLPANTNCVVTIATGAKDVAGNALASAFTWTFSTAAGKSFCEESFTQTDHFTPAISINSQNGWSATGYDEQVENVGPAAQTGQNVWRLSNKVVSGSYSGQPLSPQLPESAGESTVRSAGGGDAMEAVFWMQPVSPSADGSAITISMSPTTADRQTYFRIENNQDANGGYQITVIDYYDVNNTNTYRTFVPSTGISRTAWAKVRLVLETPDGGTNDVFQVFLNDALVGTYSSWEDYHTWPLGGNSVTEAVDRLLFRVSIAPSGFDPSFVDADARGFYFDNLCYRVYNRATPGSTIQFYRTGFEP